MNRSNNLKIKEKVANKDKILKLVDNRLSKDKSQDKKKPNIALNKKPLKISVISDKTLSSKNNSNININNNKKVNFSPKKSQGNFLINKKSNDIKQAMLNEVATMTESNQIPNKNYNQICNTNVVEKSSQSNSFMIKTKPNVSPGKTMALKTSAVREISNTNSLVSKIANQEENISFTQTLKQGRNRDLSNQGSNANRNKNIYRKLDLSSTKKDTKMTNSKLKMTFSDHYKGNGFDLHRNKKFK